GGVWPYSDNHADTPYYGLPQSTVDLIAAGGVRALVDWVSVAPAMSVGGRTQAESANWRSGVDIEDTTDTGGGRNIGWISNGDFVAFDARDFATGVSGLKV